MKALVVEDDLIIALEYEMTLSKMGIQLIGREKSISGALKKIRTEVPDFVILDIHLSDQDNGLDLLSELNKRFIPCIIVTGYPKEEFYNKALSHQANAFLTKPVNKLTLQYEIQKIVDHITQHQESTSFIFIKEKKSSIKIPFGNITYIITKGNYSTIHTLNSKYLIRRSLSTIMESLDTTKFIQVHRSTILNLDKLKRVNFVKAEIELLNGVILKIGQNYFEDLKSYLDKNPNI